MNRISSSIIAVLIFIPVGSVLAGCSSASPNADGTEIVVAAAPTPSSPSPGAAVATPGKSISVRGVGTASATPNQATLTIGVETVSTTAQAALRDNSSKAAELIKVLKASGVEDKNMQTSQLSIFPRFDEKGTKVVGYQVSNTVTATVKDIAKVGPVIDAASVVAGDAIRMQNLSFGLSDDAAAMKVARTKAVENAKVEAEQLAAAAGVKLGALRVINSSSRVDAQVLNQFGRETAADSGSAIQPGSADVTAEVDLIFELIA
jgi:uncharacterized protein